MRYELMFPDQLREAIDKNLPAVMAIGVMEYHSEHCCVGVDTVVVSRALDILEKEMEMVILPPFVYGTASYAVSSPEGKGTISIGSHTVYLFAKELFGNLLRVGFRNVHLFIHHQSENFTAGMPTDLALKLAARETIFEFLEKERGEGWWGKQDMQDYYKKHEKGSDPFSWIQIHPFMDELSQKQFPIDHAGIQETSLMMAFCPEGVDMKRHSKDQWYAQSAKDANMDYANAAKKMILAGMKKALSRK
ncbi:MAG: creatinine amidohydrolase [Planctomycetes bacterium GWF2_42_9]|nr:MAG: creatinine amidohydrolase [Planctomycetes bacterium GWF2_42_9]